MIIQRILLMARTTYSEAVRARFFSVLLFISLGILLTATFFQQFDFGTSELKFILDFGFGAVRLFGTILCVVLTTQVFFNEIEHRTAISILCRDIARWEFLLGKLIGIAALLLVFCLVTGGLLAVVLAVKASALQVQSQSGTPLVHLGEVFVFLLLQWFKFTVTAALTLCVATLSRSSLYTMVVSFLAILACELQSLASDIYVEAQTSLGRAFGWLLKAMVPNLQIYNLGDRLVLTDATMRVPLETYASIALLTLTYVSIFFGMAVLFFRNREI